MDPVAEHARSPHVSFDGGDLDCGNGLLLLIRKHIDPMEPGQLLEIRSTEISVEEDLPAWCRLTGNDLVSWTKKGSTRSFLVRRGGASAAAEGSRSAAGSRADDERRAVQARAAAAIAPGSVFGIGSWPRPSWMVWAIEEHLRGRLSAQDFEAAGDDAVRLAVAAQERAGVDLVSDGEQRRDSYASFVGSRLDACQLIPLTDLLPLVDDPDKLEKELRALDVPAAEVRHPALFGKLARTKPLVAHEVRFLLGITERPVKVALPGPYLLTRTLWLDCFRERAYASREELAADVVRVLREEVAELVGLGVSLIQFDEPVLTEVVFAGPANQRTFMCGALSEKKEPEVELAFAKGLVNAVVDGFPRDQTALHVCRGNWTTDESVLLAGDYRPLESFFAGLKVGTLCLEFSTPRAGEFDALRGLPSDMRIGVGVLNPRSPRVESEETLLARMQGAANAFGRDRVLFHPDCGFATFAANPVASGDVAEAKLSALARARDRFSG